MVVIFLKFKIYMYITVAVVYYCYCYYIHLTTFFPGQPKVRTILDFNEAGDDGVPVASAGHYALRSRQLHQHPITQFFMGRILFLPPNQQCQLFIMYSTQHKLLLQLETWHGFNQ